MAEIKKGILGGFSGKVGPIVGANWRGKDIIRSTPKPSSKPKTDKQIMQQLKFKATISFLQPLRTIQSRFFGSNAGAKSKVNLAASYVISNAVEVVAGLPAIVYNKVLVTKGDLTGFQNVEVVPQAGGIFTLSWENNAAQGNALETDKATALFYFEDLGVFEIYEGIAARGDAMGSITLPIAYAGKVAQVYSYLYNDAETQACNSVHLGAITVL